MPEDCFIQGNGYNVSPTFSKTLTIDSAQRIKLSTWVSTKGYLVRHKARSMFSKSL
jgi:uncharacterized protein YdeI (BOF family)